MVKHAGIYRILVRRRSEVRFYIGQASNIHVRWTTHLWRLRTGKHRNPALQAAFNKHGESHFSIEIVLLCAQEKAVLTMYEQAVLDLQIRQFGEQSVYNTHRQCVSSRLGVKISEQTRARMSLSQKGRVPSPVAIEKARTVNLGRKLSSESIAKRTAKQRGRIVRPETRARHALSLIGIKRSPETCARISVGKKGWKPSLEHLAHLRKLAAASIGKPRPAHVHEALRLAKLGKKKSAEEIARRQATRAANQSARLGAY